MKIPVALAFLITIYASTASADPEPRKVFVVDKVSQVGTAQIYGNSGRAQEGEHHSAPVVMGEFAKKCPTVSFTKNRESADFILETQPGGSSLSNQKGDVVYVSPAKTLKNMTKDMCSYISAH